MTDPLRAGRRESMLWPTLFMWMPIADKQDSRSLTISEFFQATTAERSSGNVCARRYFGAFGESRFSALRSQRWHWVLQPEVSMGVILCPTSGQFALECLCL